MSLKNTSYFNPTSITGCQLWLDGKDPAGTGVLPAIGASIATWADKSGQGQTITQATSGNQALYTLGGGLTFTSGMQYPLNTTVFMNIFSIAYTIFVVEKRATNGLGFFIGNNAGGGGPLYLGYNANTAMRFTTAQVVDMDYTVPGYTGSDATEPIRIWACRWFGTTANLRDIGLNGQITPQSQAFNLAPSFSGGSQTIGGCLYGNYVGKMYEMIIFNQAISDLAKQQIEGYLAWKWSLTASLPSSHPYALVPSYGVPSLVPNATAKTTQTNSQHPVLAVSGCALWFDGTDPLGTGRAPANGTSLTTWANKGTTSVTLAYGTSQPTYSANFQNGLGSVSFNNNYFSAAYSFNLQTKSAFIVCSQSNNATDSPQGILSFYGSGADTVASTNGYGYQATQGGYGSFGWLYNIFAGGSTGYYIPTGTAGANTPMGIYGNVFSNQYEQTFKDGSSVTNFTISTTPGMATNLMVGARLISGGLRGSFFGNICEIIVYTVALSTTQRQNIEGYLAQKWGLTANLPAGHPYKSTFPLYPAAITTGVRSVANKRWSPLTPGGCGLWLDAADTSTLFQDSAGTTRVIANGQPIGLWRDKSGTGHDFTQTSSGNQPTFTSSANGAIQLSSPTYLQASAASLGTVSTSANLTIIMTASTGPSATWQIILAQWFTGTTRFHLSFQSGTDLTPNLRSNSTGTELSYPMSGTMAYNRTYTIGFIATGTALYMSFMGTSNTTTMSAALSTNPSSALTIADSRNANLTDGKIQEIIIYPSAISTAAFQQAEGYLAWKWGLKASLPSSHPYKLFPPSP
jgi:hypothetical protein